MTTTKPIIKWVGGKRRIMKHIIENIPLDFKNYYEPFLGGASVFLNTPFKHKAYINDFTPDLVNVYNQVKNNPQNIITSLTLLREEYLKAEDKKKFFLNQRDIYNSIDRDFEKAVIFIFINKTCFNGKMTFRKDKTLSSAFGKHMRPGIFDEGNIKKFSEIFSSDNIILTNLDYYECVKDAKKGDFVYLDPPYVPDDKTGFNYLNFYRATR